MTRLSSAVLRARALIAAAQDACAAASAISLRSVAVMRACQAQRAADGPAPDRRR